MKDPEGIDMDGDQSMLAGLAERQRAADVR
jgi:hypothetical protein